MEELKPKTSWLRIFSYGTRLLLPAVMVAALLIRPMVLRSVFPRVSPYFSVSSAVAIRAVTIASIASITLLILCALYRRWFCRWVCPVGLACEVCAKARKRRPSLKRVPPIGRYLAMITLGGAVASVPFFLWMDPLLIVSCGITVGCSFAAFLAVIVLASFIFPGLWCTKICPLGGMQDLLGAPRSMMKTGKRKEKFAMARRSFLGLAVGVAAGFAMKWVISPITRRIRPPGAQEEDLFKAMCVRCGNCVGACPAGIIKHDRNSPDAAGIMAPMVRFEEDYCRQDCNRCGRSCPTGAIEHLSLAEKNRRKIAIPKIDDPACRLSWEVECDICVFECPCEALEGVFNKEEYRYSMGVDLEKCNGCGLCRIVCPEKAITMEALPCEES